MSNGFLVIGSIPPPIGGVTIHVKRLLEQLNLSGIKYHYFDLKHKTIFDVFAIIFKFKTIHLHTSSTYARFVISIFCFFLNKTLLLTYHGNIDRYGIFKNQLDKIALRLAKVPILINKESFTKTLKINKNARLVSAFIPPSTIEKADTMTKSIVDRLKCNYSLVFCTNAYNVALDKNKREIYQITDLVKLFNEFKDKALIISDPSGKYAELLKKNEVNWNDNIELFSFPHDFNAIIAESDCMIRFTTTDGDSLSVKEALLVGKPVIATDVVDRPIQVILVNDNLTDLLTKIQEFTPQKNIVFNENGFNDLFKLYKENLID